MAGHVGGEPVPAHELVLPDAFWDLIKMPPEDETRTGCWEWQGIQWKSGYGRWNQHNWGYWTHRITFAQYRGAIPEGMQLDHLCMNKICCSPFHLDVVTQKENTRRWAEQTIQACPKGHPYTPENLVRGSARRCKTCHREYERNRRTKMVAEGRKTRTGHPGRPVSTHTKLGWMISQSGLYLYEITGLVGVSNTMLEQYIAGKRVPAARHIVALCDLFQCEPEDILGPRTTAQSGGSRTADRGAPGPPGGSDGGLRGEEDRVSPSRSDVPGGVRQADPPGVRQGEVVEDGLTPRGQSDREHGERTPGPEDQRSRNGRREVEQGSDRDTPVSVADPPAVDCPTDLIPRDGEWHHVVTHANGAFIDDQEIMCRAKIPGVCQGRAAHSHHRKMRSRGGTNAPENLMRVCFACHDWIHGHPAEATEQGFLLHAWDDESPLL